jgi:hypothetical protein
MAKFRTITVKFAGECRRCGTTIPKGTRARWAKGRGLWCLGGCDEDSADRAEADLARREQERMDSEYAQGVADAERYLSDKRMYGEELAEQWEMEAELARYNRGEDY